MSVRSVDQVGEALPGTFSISVIIQASPSANPWLDSHWEAIGIVAGEAERLGDNPEVELMHERDGIRQYLHRGFSVRLHEDECESYYYNLMSPAPCAYVVASVDDDGRPSPLLVSLSYDEAHAYLEGDQTLYSVPIPPELYQWSEAFVLVHYMPEKRTKRKRQDWKGETDGERS